MIFPYQRTPPVRTVGLVTKVGDVIGEAGADAIYVGADRCRDLLTQGFGSATCWNGDPIRLHLPDGRDALVLRTDHASDRAMLDGLVLWRDMLAAMGARVGSLGSSAWSLWRASLTAPIHDAAGTPPPLHNVIGGRQELPRGPGRFHDAYHHDITAAYPRTLARLTYGGAWEYHDVGSWREVERWASAGIMAYLSAEVRLRGWAFGPLPRRHTRALTAWEAALHPVEYPRSGVIRGFWSAPEVLAAVREGAGVKLRGVWVHGSIHQPWLRWWDRVQMLRAAPGYAAVLGKAMGSAMWGQLAITDGERTTLTFENGRRRVRRSELPGGGRPRMYDVAEYVTGSVRSRLYGDLLAPMGERVIAAHTDGAWLDTRGGPAGDGWRLKEHAVTLDVMNPQCYRYRVEGRSGFVYKVAGVDADHARGTFRELWHNERWPQPDRLTA
jgi:hypothetical protein